MEKVDEKGKLFTERVHKTRVEVRVITLQGEVHGYMHVTHDQRVKDLVNNGAEQFLAVTDATIRGQGNVESQQIEFIALNKQHIVLLIPIGEDRLKQQRDEEYYIPQY
jgi:hypothetical protein